MTYNLVDDALGSPPRNQLDPWLDHRSTRHCHCTRKADQTYHITGGGVEAVLVT